MTLSATNVGSNPQTPGIAAEIFVPDQLIAGQFPLVTQPITIASGASVLPRGTVLGQITASGKYIQSLSAASDGSQTPIAILADQADPTSGDVQAGAYFAGEFNSNALSLGTGWTVASVTIALRDAAIYIKTVAGALSNSAPS